MKQKTCKDCIQYKDCKDSFVSWIFFIIGLIATIAIRIVIVLNFFDPLYGKIAWYIGVIGFLLFFIYKFRVAKARARLIIEKNLVEKISLKKRLSDEDYDLVSKMLCALVSKKESINYFFIFGLSGIALLLALYLDFMR